jgi:hypothetical protein
MSFKTQHIQVDGSINVDGTLYLSGVPLPSDTTTEKVNRSGDTMSGGLVISAGGFKSTGDTSLYGDVHISQHLQIGGNLTVDGSLIYTNIQSINVSTGFIQLSTGIVGTPPSTLQSGIIVNRGTSDPYVFVYDEDGQNFRIGIATISTSTHYNDASTQAVATRQDSPTSNGVGYWNSGKFRIDTSPGFVYNPANGEVSINGNIRGAGNIYLPSGGNLWIGTASDSSGRIRIHQSSNNSFIDFGNQLYIRGGLTASNYLVNCTSTGMVGIGIGNNPPLKMLHIYNSTDTTDTAIRLGSGTAIGDLKYNTTADSLDFINYSQWGSGAPSAAASIRWFTNNDTTTPKMYLHRDGNLGIGNVTPEYPLDVTSTIRASTGMLTSSNYFEKYIGEATFVSGEANKAYNVSIPNVAFWGYIEVEVTSSYNEQSSAGKLTKLFAVGVNPNNNIYINETRVSDSMGTVPDNIAIGNFAWDSGSSTYIIPLSHIVSTLNNFAIKVKMFTVGSTAKDVYGSLSLSSKYTLTALARNYVYYNGKMGIGTTSPTSILELSAAGNGYWNNSNDWTSQSPPLSTLTISSTTNGGYDSALLFRQTDSAAVTKNAGAIGLVGRGAWTSGNNTTQISDMYFGVRNGAGGISERMRIRYDGNVGIGSNDPGSKLTVIGGFSLIDDGVADSTAVRFFNSSGNLYLQCGSGENIIFRNKTGGEIGRMNNNGYMSLGTTNAPHPLTILQNIYPALALYSDYNYSSNRNWAIVTNSFGSGSWGGLAFRVSNAQDGNPLSGSKIPLGIDINGQVGVGGQISPSYTLDVSGTVRSTGDMTATNFNLSSDETLKTNIIPIQKESIDIEYKEFELISQPGQKRYGVIAQELQKTNPELVRTDADGLLNVAYIDLLIKEIASLKERVAELERKNE